jgi:hypothetical protein
LPFLYFKIAYTYFLNGGSVFKKNIFPALYHIPG